MQLSRVVQTRTDSDGLQSGADCPTLANGVPNKPVAQAKENIVAVFTRLGGTAAMATWAQRNQTEFYRLYARLIPGESTTQVTVRDAQDLSTEELLAIARAGHSRGEEAEPDVELDDELH